MRRFALPFAALLTLTTACGGLEEGAQGEELIEAASLEGFDLPADYAGGYYVRVKGALTRGRTKSGTFTGRDKSYGYTLTATRGETLRARGVLDAGWALVSIYGPQAADGSWGRLRAKQWTTFPYERALPTVTYKATQAGKYLVIIGAPNRGTDDTTGFALTVCNGECTANACVEWSNSDASAWSAGNFVSTAEARVAVPERFSDGRSLREGACAAQPRSCPSTRAPVCMAGTTFGNACKARVAQRDEMPAERLGITWIGLTPGACAN